ncbi:hypothetical protein psal_cds_46 [Pandoravirus salinus]|uniref:Uncharacterized protein n=1 Tax=Pandoravirus salinus TaxID=1349410 RepID=S4VSQ0_9VIRU|nr:hypothetical protein psal_cds_46 [Pandoravirus salinus]AGO83434.1 hypothetical protein psal_cds_46 [Pandoravirus salinus]
MTDPRLRYPYRHSAEPEGFVGTSAVWRGTAPPPTRNLAHGPGGLPLAWQQQQQRPYQPSLPFGAQSPLRYAYGDNSAGASDDDGDDDGSQPGSDYDEEEGSDVEYSDDDGIDNGGYPNGAYSPSADPAWRGNAAAGYVLPTHGRW